MDCEGCGELLADFLLDELPESEAVLVHEHLLICVDCMKAYRELKGTGKALDAVASMQPVTSSPDFKAAVQAKAKEESEKIVSKLPPDKRLRLEARREARHSVRMSRRMPPPKVWSPGLFVLALAAVLILAAILFWPTHDKPLTRVALGHLAVSVGTVDQFYKKEKQTYSPVEEGKSFLPGEAFKTRESASARFDLADGGSIFAGPSTDIAFHFPQAFPGQCSVLTDNGEVGFFRPDPSANQSASGDWEFKCDAGTMTISQSTHAYAHVIKHEKICNLEVSVLAGSVHLKSRDGSKHESLYAGQKGTISTTDSVIVASSLTDERPPVWRTDLTTTSDLAALFGGKVKILSRQTGQLKIELRTNHETPFHDWVSEIPGVAISAKDGHLVCPTGVRWKLVAPFVRPLQYELKLNAESRRDTSFAFAYKTASGSVAVDVSRQAVELSVEEVDKLRRSDKIFARGQPNTAESLVLHLKQEGTAKDFSASLNTSTSKSKSILLWKAKPDAAGELWFQALVEPLLLDEIIITGTLSSDWIREKLSGAQ